MGSRKSRSRKQGIISIVLLAVLGVFFLLFRKNEPVIDKRKAAFRYNEIKLTKHAVCRMECRSIDESEVKSILQKGKINYSKSSLTDKPCPVYALEGITVDNQKVRVVVGNCDQEAVIITVIDLENEHSCNCE